jgi:hypothetical protein
MCFTFLFEYDKVKHWVVVRSGEVYIFQGDPEGEGGTKIYGFMQLINEEFSSIVQKFHLLYFV